MTTSVLTRRLRESPREPLVRVPSRPVAPVAELPRACWGSAPTFISPGGSTRPKHPSTTIEFPECEDEEAEEEERVFSPIGFTPTPLRDGDCEEPIEIDEYYEIGRQFRVQRIRNPDDNEQYVDVEEALTSFMRGPEGKMERWVWAQQPPPAEVISQGFRGQEPPEITPESGEEGEEEPPPEDPPE